MKSRSVHDVSSPVAPVDAEVHWSPEPVGVAQRFWQGVFYGTLLSLPCWALILLLLKIL